MMVKPGITAFLVAMLLVPLPLSISRSAEYSQTFDFPDGTTDLEDGSIIFASNASPDGELVAQVVDGRLQLTRDDTGSTSAYFKMPSLGAEATDSWMASFDFEVSSAGSPADGFSFNYGPIAEDATGSEEGFGVGISFEFDTWNNGGGEAGHNIAVDNVDVPGGFNEVDVIADGVTRRAQIVWLDRRATLVVDDDIIFQGLATPGVSADVDYIFAFAARTGGSTEDLFIDNLLIEAPVSGTTGDFNGDGVVDLMDAQILADNFGTGTTFEQGDVNRDFRVDTRDFVDFKEIFNSQGVTAAVPEPSSLALLSLSGVALLAILGRNRRKNYTVAGLRRPPDGRPIWTPTSGQSMGFRTTASDTPSGDTVMRRFVLNSESARIWLRRATTLLAVAGFVVILAGRAQADTLSVRIADGNDDAEEHINEGNSIDLGSSDLEIGAEGGGVDAQLIGLRFLDIGIPRSATINSASIQFTVDETDDEPQTMPIPIFGELGDALTFGGNAGNISSRTRTGISVNWEDIPAWSNAGDAGPDQQTPDISPVIQAIVSQSTWDSNDALVIILGGHEQFERTAESFNGDADAAALLTIDFDPTNLFNTSDFNNDGAVDMTDFQILLSNFNTGTTFAEGDATFDGLVDLRDFNDFRQSFEAAAGGGISAVPEPSAMILAMMALVGIAWTRRRH